MVVLCRLFLINPFLINLLLVKPSSHAQYRQRVYCDKFVHVPFACATPINWGTTADMFVCHSVILALRWETTIGQPLLC